MAARETPGCKLVVQGPRKSGRLVAEQVQQGWSCGRLVG